ncbi:kinase-like domain-containing protein, partial [Gorgonomyces haynaldii]
MKPQYQNSNSRYYTDFQQLEYLGRGGFGAVVKARNLIDGLVYAIKMIKVTQTDKEEKTERLLREVQTLSRIHSSYVVRYYQAWFEEQEFSDSDSLDSEEIFDQSDWLSVSKEFVDRKEQMTMILYIQMEYCENNTLRDLIDSHLELQRAWILFRQLLEGLSHLHAQGIIHRDLKPSNIFLDAEGHVKIGDFGLATSRHRPVSIHGTLDLERDPSLTSEIGTPVYIAPEMMHSNRYNSKVDMYSLGIVFFEMIYPMKTHMERIHILRQLRLQEIVFPDDFPSDQKELIQLLLVHDPEKRPSCEEILQSTLIPKLVEEEYISEDLLKIIQQRNPKYYNKILDALFHEKVSQHTDYCYDYNSNVETDHYLMSQVYFNAIQVFMNHNVPMIHSPLLLPKTDQTDSIYSKRLAEFLDQSGHVVQLHYDLTVPFVRQLMYQPQKPLKRYCIERVFRHNTAGGQPKSIVECDFDVLYQHDHFLAEAEILVTIAEILNSQDIEIRVNHTLLLDNIFDQCLIPNRQRS